MINDSSLILSKERERELGGGSLPLASARLRGLPLPPQRGAAPQRPVPIFSRFIMKIVSYRLSSSEQCVLSKH
jgi:hypothetical protein